MKNISVAVILACFIGCAPDIDPPPFASPTVSEQEEAQPEEQASSRDSSGTSQDAVDEERATTDNETPSAKVRPQTLVINELLYDFTGSDTDGQLFVELVGDAGADIGGYKIVFVNGDGGAAMETITVLTAASIADDGLFLIADAKNGAAGDSFVPDFDFLDDFDPQNGPDCVQLLDDQGELVDAVGYGSPLPTTAENGLPCFEGTPATDVPTGKSLSRVNGADTDDNAADFVATDPTPGVL